ncbi:Reverse transcriptase (RNA-dependent DNA polymerase) [Popillia japonica]|uniref:Reverse transcriptase (RNA-dependent DNA polymerase) n=1 Tax=Popillia japonica TaxID=7064 RepID=A0AAW1JHU3_POPJA
MLFYKNLIKQTKCDYYRRSIELANNKSKKVWQIVNAALGKQNKKYNFKLSHEGLRITDPKKVADVFANHFANIAEQRVKDHFIDDLSSECTTSGSVPFSMYCAPVTEGEIMNIIANLKNNNSTEPDELTSRILGDIMEEIVCPLTHITNRCLEQGVYPSKLKVANVIPVHKKGDPDNTDNYRPISLLNVTSKIIKRALVDRIVNYMNTFKLFSDAQHGFRQGKSTETAAHEYIQFIQDKMDTKKYVAGILFDISRAFDTMCSDFVQTSVSKSRDQRATRDFGT